MNESQTDRKASSRGGKWLLAALVVLAVVAAVLLEPTGIVRGKLQGETFFQGRPTSYWENAFAGGPADRSKARQAMQRGGEEAVPVLIELLHSDESEEIRWTAAEILGDLGPVAQDASESLLAALSDPDPYVQSVAAQVIPQVGTPAVDAVPALTSLLDGEHAPVAARALSVYKAQAAAAVPQLIDVLADSSRTTDARWNAARTIGKIGPPAIEALPVLIEMTRDDESTVRGNAAEAIGDIGPTAAEGIPALIEVLDDSAPRVRHHAVRSLGYIGPAAHDAVPAIKPLIKDSDDSVREAAGAALKAIAPEAAKSVSEEEQPPVKLQPPE